MSEEEKLRKMLFKIKASHESNNKCADCDSIGTLAVDIKFGCFLCMRCSGIHRSFGTSVCRIRMLSLDKFTKDDIDFIDSVKSNAYFNSKYEATTQHKITGNTNDEHAKTYIQEKYIEKRYYKEPKKAIINGTVLPAPKMEPVSKFPELDIFTVPMNTNPFDIFDKVPPNVPVKEETFEEKKKKILSMYNT